MEIWRIVIFVVVCTVCNRWCMVYNKAKAARD
nr:MAG TPA: hypothetical protein [Crassvirales sp.]